MPTLGRGTRQVHGVGDADTVDAVAPRSDQRGAVEMWAAKFASTDACCCPHWDAYDLVSVVRKVVAEDVLSGEEVLGVLRVIFADASCFRLTEARDRHRPRVVDDDLAAVQEISSRSVPAGSWTAVVNVPVAPLPRSRRPPLVLDGDVTTETRSRASRRPSAASRTATGQVDSGAEPG